MGHAVPFDHCILTEKRMQSLHAELTPCCMLKLCIQERQQQEMSSFLAQALNSFVYRMDDL